MLVGVACLIDVQLRGIGQRLLTWAGRLAQLNQRKAEERIARHPLPLRTPIRPMS